MYLLKIEKIKILKSDLSVFELIMASRQRITVKEVTKIVCECEK